MNRVKYAHSRPLKFTFADPLIALYFEWLWKMDSYLKCPVVTKDSPIFFSTNSNKHFVDLCKNSDQICFLIHECLQGALGEVKNLN